MTKQEILSKAQKNNNGVDVADLDAQRKGAYVAYFVGLFVIMAWDIVEGILYRRINCGGNMALFAMAFAAFLTKYFRLKKRHELTVAAIYGIAATAFMILWILQLTGVLPR